MKFIFFTYFLCPSVIEELKATGKFESMDLRIDEAEHSMEMHLPYLAKVFEGWVSCFCQLIYLFCLYFEDASYCNQFSRNSINDYAGSQ